MDRPMRSGACATRALRSLASWCTDDAVVSRANIRTRRPLSIRLRPATLLDLPDLSRLAQDAKASWGYPASWLVSWASELTITQSALETLDIVVAEDGEHDAGVIVGFAALAGGESTWSLEHCWVSPRHMRRGVGRMLYRHLATRVATQGGGTLTIVSDVNAVPFYQALGATRAGDVPAPMPGAPDRRLPVLEQFVPASR